VAVFRKLTQNRSISHLGLHSLQRHNSLVNIFYLPIVVLLLNTIYKSVLSVRTALRSIHSTILYCRAVQVWPVPPPIHSCQVPTWDKRAPWRHRVPGTKLGQTAQQLSSPKLYYILHHYTMKCTLHIILYI